MKIIFIYIIIIITKLKKYLFRRTPKEIKKYYLLIIFR